MISFWPFTLLISFPTHVLPDCLKTVWFEACKMVPERNEAQIILTVFVRVKCVFVLLDNTVHYQALMYYINALI